MSKKIILSILSFMLVGFMFAAQQENEIRKFQLNNSGLKVERSSRDEVVIYEENFNSDTEWTTLDGTLPSGWNEAWHPSDEGAFEGDSWWMGDEELGGYTSHRYIVMDTPEITLGASETLTFKLNYKTEDPAGAEAPYDGWDGCNVRISTDGGTTWEVITPTTPAYNCDALYSFGYEFYEGTSVAGWGGSTDGWVDASFDLSAYANDDVKIRFAFASDPGYDTADDATLFGMKVDNIAVGSFTSNADSADEMTVGYGGIVGGDLWHIGEDATAPSAPTAAICQNAAGSYDPYMQNYIVSPAINIPEGTGIAVDFQVRGGFNDPDEFPDVEHWSFEKSSDNGATWSAVITNEQGQNIVFSDAPEAYASFTEAYQQGVAVDLTAHANSTMMFRFGFNSDGDTPDGIGLFIDDFKITSSAFTPAPMNLEAEVQGYHVALEWENPFGAPGEEGWKTWDNGITDQVIGYSNATEPTLTALAHKFDQNDLLGYNGFTVDKIRFAGGLPEYSYTAKIWTGDAATEAVSQAYTGTITSGEYQEVVLTTPHVIDASTPLWIGVEVAFIGDGLYLDNGPAIVGKGMMIAQNGGAFSDVSGSIDRNLCVGGYLTDANGRAIELTHTPTVDRNRDIEGYKIYRSTESGDFDMSAPIATIDDPEVTTYVDETPVPAVTNYYVVTATYPEGESQPSNEASATPSSPTHYTYSHDDGTAEAGYTPTGVQDLMVKFTPTPHETLDYVKVYGMKVYLESTSAINIVANVYRADAEGNPETTAALTGNLAGADLVDGWNTIAFNNYEGEEFAEDTDFFCSVKVLPGGSVVGVDTNNSGNSVVKSGATVEDYTEGNFMLRAIVDEIIADNEGENVVTPNTLAISNFPNPFNPTTTINYNMAVAGKVNVKVYNSKGQLVNTLVDGVKEAGNKQVTWTGKDNNGNDVSSGVYFYKVTTENASSTKKMLLMK